MIICSCNVISDHDIVRVVVELKEKTPRRKITTDLIFAALGTQPQCGTCIANVSKIAHDYDVIVS